MPSIYQLANEWVMLEEAAESAPTEEMDVFKDTLEGIEGEIEWKADGYAKVMRNLEAQAEGMKAEETRLATRRKAIENNIARMKQALQEAMQLTGKTKFKTELFSFNVQNNPASCDIAEGTKLPEKYLIQQEPKVNRKQIIADLKEGKEIAGCTLTQSQSLRIR